MNDKQWVDPSFLSKLRDTAMRFHPVCIIWKQSDLRIELIGSIRLIEYTEGRFVASSFRLLAVRPIITCIFFSREIHVFHCAAMETSTIAKLWILPLRWCRCFSFCYCVTHTNGGNIRSYYVREVFFCTRTFDISTGVKEDDVYGICFWVHCSDLP